VVSDQIGSPTYARDLARVILDLLYEIKNLRGVSLFHYANSGVASWYDFALAIRDLAGLNCTISPIPTDKYPARARRPFYSVLDKEKIMDQFGVSVPYWRESLLECIRKIR
jgi:dTDP-4-dehydrorhamnose reductase